MRPHGCPTFSPRYDFHQTVDIFYQNMKTENPASCYAPVYGDIWTHHASSSFNLDAKLTGHSANSVGYHHIVSLSDVLRYGFVDKGGHQDLQIYPNFPEEKGWIANLSMDMRAILLDP